MITKPRRAIVLFYEEGEDITVGSIRERLDGKAYAIVNRPAVMHDPAGNRRLRGVIAMPDDVLEADKRRRTEASA